MKEKKNKKNKAPLKNYLGLIHRVAIFMYRSTMQSCEEYGLSLALEQVLSGIALCN